MSPNMSGGTGRIKSAQAALSLPPELEEEEEELESLDLLDSAGLLSFELDSVLLSLFWILFRCQFFSLHYHRRSSWTHCRCHWNSLA